MHCVKPCPPLNAEQFSLTFSQNTPQAPHLSARHHFWNGKTHSRPSTFALRAPLKPQAFRDVSPLLPQFPHLYLNGHKCGSFSKFLFPQWLKGIFLQCRDIGFPIISPVPATSDHPSGIHNCLHHERLSAGCPLVPPGNPCSPL